MRIASSHGRALLVSADGTHAVDVGKVSSGRFGPSAGDVLRDWAEFHSWATSADRSEEEPIELADLEAPSPTPRQVFAIGLNYRDHADESKMAYPDAPPTFTKFVSSFAGPVTTLALPNETVDWEAELVVVIGREARRVAEDEAWQYVAGLTAGQDYSQRTLQLSGPVPQFSLGKSFPGFSPQGPWLVTLDEFEDCADLRIQCTVNGEQVQASRTGQLIFKIPHLIAFLSSVTTLYPGDVIFTGTPSGIGAAREPKWFLKPGDIVETTIEGIGTLRQTCVPGGPR